MPPARPSPQVTGSGGGGHQHRAGPAWKQQVAAGGRAVPALPAADNPAQEGKLLASWKKQRGHGALREAALEEPRAETASQAGCRAWGAMEHEGGVWGHRGRPPESTQTRHSRL